MNISEITKDLQNMNPQIFEDNYLIRKGADIGFHREESHEKRVVIKYLPAGPTVNVYYTVSSAYRGQPAVIIDIIDGV